ncbi:MAG: alpha/beta hydrolase-fold protein [Verrucomicrobiota bacterium]
MTKHLSLPLVGSLIALTTSLPVLAQNVAPRQEVRVFSPAKAKGEGLGYLLYLPTGYQTEPQRHWPLVLFLHGSGERGTNVSVVAVHGPPKLVNQGRDFPFILVSPQCPPKREWSDKALLGLLDEIERQCRVDTNRVYLTGLSMGGYGTWNLGLKHPERFAALVPICGGGNPKILEQAGAAQAKAIRSLPIRAFHGVKDPTVPVAESERMVDALKKFGCPEVSLMKYPELGHDCWTVTYDNPELFDWLLLQHRQ